MENILKQTERNLSKVNENIQTVIIALLAFLVPTFLAQLIKTIFGAESVITNHSQIIVGSIVNTVLVLAALNLKGGAKNAFVVTMPSVSTILSGYVFKSASPYMVWMVPAIWIGNFVLILAFKYIKLAKKKNYFLAAIAGILGKVAIIFGFFAILKTYNVFPEKLVANLQNAMSLTQLITATIGCVVAFGISKIGNLGR